MSQIKSLRTGIKFKDTPIGKIPVDWEVTSIEKIAFLEYGASLPEKKRLEGPIPVYGSNGIVGYHNEKLLKGPGIIIGRKGTVGAVTWSDNDFWPIDTTYFISKAQSKGILNLRWFYYLLFNLHLEKLNAATGIPGINRSAVHSLIIPLPPLSEQENIAEILTTVDDGIEETDRIIEKTKELKKGLMQKLFTRGIGHEKFKKTEIGKIPEEWEVGKILDYGEIVTGSTPSTLVKEYYGNDFPFVSPFDLGKVKVIIKTEKHLSKEGASVARMLPANTILFVCIGSTIGKTGVAGVQLATNQQINAIICEGSDFNFVYYYLSFISDKIKQIAGTQAVPIVNKSLFSNVVVVIPKLDEQQEIGNILSSVDSEIEDGENHKRNLETLKKSLMQILLTGKVRVKLH